MTALLGSGRKSVKIILEIGKFADLSAVANRFKSLNRRKWHPRAKGTPNDQNYSRLERIFSDRKSLCYFRKRPTPEYRRNWPRMETNLDPIRA